MGVDIHHRKLEGCNSHLIQTEGVHLNYISLVIFLSEVQDRIEQDLFLLGGGLSQVLVYMGLWEDLEVLLVVQWLAFCIKFCCLVNLQSLTTNIVL